MKTFHCAMAPYIFVWLPTPPTELDLQNDVEGRLRNVNGTWGRWVRWVSPSTEDVQG